MKINVNDARKVQAALDEAQKGLRAGIYDANIVISDARAAEAMLDAVFLLKGERQGATFSGYARTGTKKWRYATTVITLERGVSDWFLTGIHRADVWDDVGDWTRLPQKGGPSAATIGYRALKAAGVGA